MVAGVSINRGDYYSLVEVDLGTAHDRDEIIVPNTYRIYRLYLDGDMYLTIGERGNPPINMTYIAEIVPAPLPARNFYVENTAQPGKKCVLLFAHQEYFATAPARLGSVQVQNASGVTINPATEDTLSSGIKIKNAAGTVINPATEDTLSSGIKVKNAAGTVINPATEDTLSSGIKIKNAAGTVINPATENTLSSINSKISSDQPRHITNAYDSTSDRFKVDVKATVNPPNLDVALSTRASETTLTQVRDRLARPTSVGSASKSVGTTATALFASSTPSKHAVIRADPANTDIVYVGSSSAQAFPLQAGECLDDLRIDDLSKVYVKAASGTQTVRVYWEN